MSCSLRVRTSSVGAVILFLSIASFSPLDRYARATDDPLTERILQGMEKSAVDEVPIAFKAEMRVYNRAEGIAQEKPTQVAELAFWHDGKRICADFTVGPMGKTGQVDPGERRRFRHLILENGSFSDRREKAGFFCYYDSPTEETRFAVRANMYAGAFLDGWLYQTRNRLIDFFRTPAKVSRSDSMERVGEYPCWKISSDSPIGECSAWVDPERGFCVRRAVIRIEGEDLFWGKPLGETKFADPQSSLENIQSTTLKSLEIEIRDVVIEDIRSRFLPTAGNLIYRETYATGYERESRWEAVRKDVVFNPDFGVEAPFKVDWPEKTTVQGVGERQGITYLWTGNKLQLGIDKEVSREIVETVRTIKEDRSFRIASAPSENRRSSPGAENDSGGGGDASSPPKAQRENSSKWPNRSAFAVFLAAGGGVSFIIGRRLMKRATARRNK